MQLAQRMPVVLAQCGAVVMYARPLTDTATRRLCWHLA